MTNTFKPLTFAEAIAKIQDAQRDIERLSHSTGLASRKVWLQVAARDLYDAVCCLEHAYPDGALTWDSPPT